jgi:hypothetical protein
METRTKAETKSMDTNMIGQIRDYGNGNGQYSPKHVIMEAEVERGLVGLYIGLLSSRGGGADDYIYV